MYNDLECEKQYCQVTLCVCHLEFDNITITDNYLIKSFEKSLILQKEKFFSKLKPLTINIDKNADQYFKVSLHYVKIMASLAYQCEYSWTFYRTRMVPPEYHKIFSIK